MTNQQFRAHLTGLINRAKLDLPLEIIHQALSEEMDAITGDLWLHKHYKGYPPPRLPNPKPCQT